MKIGIDIRTVCGKASGKGLYTYNMVKELLAEDKKNEYILYTNSISQDMAVFPNAHIKVIHKHPALWHFVVIKDFQKENGEIFFAPASFIIPAFLPKKYRSIIMIHDLVAFLHPRLHQTKATIIERLLLGRALRKTSAVLVPSQNTKKDLMRIFKYPEEKITVTPLASCHGESVESMTRNISKKYNLPKNFILTVSGLEPRKNVGVLIDAFCTAVKSHPNLKLVIVGGKGWKSKKLQKKVEGLKHNILWIQNCDSEDLPAIYHHAKVFVFPSLYEGFGLPPLEAMANECPVICSNAGSLPEVVGDAALTFSPNDTEKLISHLINVLNDNNLKKKLVEKGKNQAAKFSWEKTAEKTLETLNNV